eukprot:6488430-Amphidinium_carterae.1
MVQGGAYPNCFFHKQHQVQLTCHSDDIVLQGEEQGLDAVEAVIGLRFQAASGHRGGDPDRAGSTPHLADSGGSRPLGREGARARYLSEDRADLAFCANSP